MSSDIPIPPDDSSDGLSEKDAWHRRDLDYRDMEDGRVLVRKLELCVPSSPLVEHIRLATQIRVRFALQGSSGDPVKSEELLALPEPDPRNLVSSIVSNGCVPSEHLYRTFDGVNLWLDLCYSHQGARSGGKADTYKTSVRQIAALAPTLVNMLDEDSAIEHGVRLVDLGPGSGEKTVPLLCELKRQGYDSVDLDLVDASHPMLVSAMQTIFDGPSEANLPADLRTHIHGLSFRQLSDVGVDRPAGQQAIFSLVGLTVGNFPVREIFAFLKGICRPGDLLLVDYQPYDSQRGLEALRQDYDSRLYREFALQPLLRIIELVRMQNPDAACELSINDIVVTAERHGSKTRQIPEIVFRLKSKASRRFQGFVRRYIDASFVLPHPLKLHFSHKYLPRDFNLSLDRKGGFDRTGSEILVSTPSGRGYKLLIASRRSDDERG